MHQIPGLLVDRHNRRGPVVGAVGTQEGAVAENQRAQKHSVHYNGFFRFRHNNQPPFIFDIGLPGTAGIYS